MTTVMVNEKAMWHKLKYPRDTHKALNPLISKMDFCKQMKTEEKGY